ncbi:MAG: plastocyanin/azurin family copper-binding protein, partial [Solirubrobacteraceae bacterium]
MRRLLIVPLAAATLAVAGCGSSSTTDPGPSNAPSAVQGSPSTETNAAEGTAGAATVGMKNIEFNPKGITVKVGEKITWTNNEDVPHNVTADSGADFKSETFSKDGTFSYTP